MGMKERTALAAFQVHKVLTIAGEKQPFKVAGHLKKGKYVHIYLTPTTNETRGRGYTGVSRQSVVRLACW